MDSTCTSCKTITIPSTYRWKQRTTEYMYPLEEMQVDNFLISEPLELSSESRYNYFLIRTFRLIVIHDKSTDVWIDSIELVVSRIPNNKKKLKEISHIRMDTVSEFRSDIFRKWCSENNIRFTTAAPK